jgi:hypothetical protein
MTTTAAGEDDGRRLRYRGRVGLLAALVGAIWAGLLLDPLIGALAWRGVVGVGLALGIVLAALGLAWLGFGLFAAGVRVAGWVRRASSWPDE